MLLSEVLSCNSMHEDYGKQIPKFSVFFLPKMHIFAKKKEEDMHIGWNSDAETAQISFGAGCVCPSKGGSLMLMTVNNYWL